MQLCWFLFTFYGQNDLLYFWCIIHLIQFISIHFNSFLFKLLLSTIVVYLVDLDQFFSFNFQKYKLLSSYICQIYTVLGAKFTQIDIITILKLTLRFRTPCSFCKNLHLIPPFDFCYYWICTTNSKAEYVLKWMCDIYMIQNRFQFKQMCLYFLKKT